LNGDISNDIEGPLTRFSRNFVPDIFEILDFKNAVAFLENAVAFFEVEYLKNVGQR